MLTSSYQLSAVSYQLSAKAAAVLLIAYS